MLEYMNYLAFWTPGPLEIIIIALVALLIFGKRLPEIARNVGKSFNEFKKGIHEAKQTKDDFDDEVNKFKDDVERESKDNSESEYSENTSEKNNQ